MAVTVVVERYNSGGPGHVDVYAEANSIRIEDGHLYVQKTQGTSRTNLGVYAPNNWRNVYKDDGMEFKKV